MSPRLLAAGIFGAMFVACQLFGPADRAAIATDAAKLEFCQEIGRACKDDGGAHCYQRYYDCTVDAGLR